MKQEVMKMIDKCKLIAILRGIPADKLIQTAEALYAGGIRLLEVTYSPDKRVSDEETAVSIKKLADHFKGRMYIGAGTVLTAKQVRMTKENDGLFIISPNTKEEVIKESSRCGLVSIPGALTPTEIAAADEYGADYVKIFPAGDMGVKYVKSVMAPMPHIKMLAVGGIEAKDIPDYLAIGIRGFGVASSLTDKKMIEENDWEGIAGLARAYTKVIENA